MRRYVAPSGPQPVPGTATRHPTRRRGNRPTAGEWCVVPAERMGKSPPTDPRERDDPLATRARARDQDENDRMCVFACVRVTRRQATQSVGPPRHRMHSLRANTARVECCSGRSGKAAAAPELYGGSPSLGPSPRGAPPRGRARCGSAVGGAPEAEAGPRKPKRAPRRAGAARAGRGRRHVETIEDQSSRVAFPL